MSAMNNISADYYKKWEDQIKAGAQELIVDTGRHAAPVPVVKAFSREHGYAVIHVRRNTHKIIVSAPRGQRIN